VLVSAGVRWQPFSAAAAAELPAVADPAAWAVPAAEAAARRDLRGPEFLVASIDPPGALRPMPRCQLRYPGVRLGLGHAASIDPRGGLGLGHAASINPLGRARARIASCVQPVDDMCTYVPRRNPPHNTRH